MSKVMKTAFNTTRTKLLKLMVGWIKLWYLDFISAII